MIGLQLPGINNSETVSMELDPPFYTPLPAADMNRDVGVPLRSRKRARGDDDDIVASCVFASNSRANGINGTEVNDEITHLQQKLEEKDFELNRLKYKLSETQGEIKTVEAMSEARQSSYERALKELEIRELEKTKERDADFQKMKTDLDTLVQEKDDLLVLLKGRQKDAKKEAEIIAAEMIAVQKAFSRTGKGTAITTKEFESQAAALAALEAERDRLHKQLQATETSSAILCDLNRRLSIANDEVWTKDKIILELKLAHDHLQSSNDRLKNQKEGTTEALNKALEEIAKRDHNIEVISYNRDALQREWTALNDEKVALQADLEAELKEARNELQSMDTMSCEKDALNVKLEDQLNIKNALVGDLKAELASMKTAHESLLRIIEVKDAELEENKLKLDATESSRVELSAKLELEAASSSELRANFKVTKSELQEALEAIDGEKNALATGFIAKLASMKVHLKHANETAAKEIFQKNVLKADLETQLKGARDELQSMESKLDTMSCEKDALNVQLEDRLNITNSLVADLKAELTSIKTAHESLLRIIEVKDAELEENKLKLDATESSRVELSAKLELEVASLSELEAKLLVTKSELQEVLEATDSEKNALVAGFNAELEFMKLNLKAANENLLKTTLEKDMELQENKLKLDEVQALRVELSNKLDAEAVSSARIRYELEQAEAAANQASEAKDSIIQDLTSELLQIKEDLYDIQLHKDAFERQVSTELSTKDDIIHQLRNELSGMPTTSSTLSLSETLQERENEVRELKNVGISSFLPSTIAHPKKELHKVRQDKASVEDILSAARVSTTQYKAKVESMDSELINARSRLEVVEAEKIILTAKLDLLKTVPAQSVPASESVSVSLQGQQEARVQEVGDDHNDLGTPEPDEDESFPYQEELDNMNVDETDPVPACGATRIAAPSSSLDSHVVSSATLVSTSGRSVPQLQRAKARISVAQLTGKRVITIPPRVHTNPSARSRDEFITLDPRRSQRLISSRAEELPTALHVEHPQPSPSTTSDGLSGFGPRSTPTRGRGGSLMRGRVRSRLRVPQSTTSNEGDGIVSEHVAPTALHVEHPQPSPSTTSDGLSGFGPRSTPTRGRGGSLMRGRVRSRLRVPRSTTSNEGDGIVSGHVAP
ncbi:hypothetical protein C0992_001975 [Termitomyces sp. T32_za158]|nr:hypothetical protein C0992_001975 [Termitomyces sp. T32_za158]